MDTRDPAVPDAVPARDARHARRGAPPLRVVSVIDAATVSGPARQLAALACDLAERGVDLHVVTFQRYGRPGSAFAEFLRGSGVAVTVLRDMGPADVRLVWRLRATIRTLAPDVVQTHGYRPTALVFALRQLGLRLPWIAFFHGATFENRKVRFYNWLDSRLMPFADRIVVMSERHRARFASVGGQVCVVHNAAIPVVEDAAASARTSRLIEALPLTGPVVGVVGRLSPEKGVDVFLDAIAILVRSGVSLSAVVAGDGPERGRLEAQRAALGLDEVVHFLGALDAISPLYGLLDLLVIPSRSEGLPNVLLEALRSDVAVVATDVGAVPEVLGDTRAGIIVAPGSPRALAEAIDAALAASGDEEAARDRRAVAERFSLDRRAREHLGLYGDLLGHPPSRARTDVSEAQLIVRAP
jgi:glycosyltransferase involved in cell wall biosynthesis